MNVAGALQRAWQIPVEVKLLTTI